MTTSAARRSPLHLQISAMLAREIQSGILVDGEKLAPERQMAVDLGISVGTLRKALLDLEDKGMLQRVHGSGNYVHHSVEAENAYALFRLERVTGSGEPSANLLEVIEVPKPKDFPEFGESDHAYRFRRIRLLGNVNVALEEIYLDANYASTIRKEDVSDSLYRYYKHHLGFWITRAEDRIGISSSPQWAPHLWHLDAGECCGFVERLSRDQKGNLAEYSRTWFDSNLVRFVSRS